MKRADQKTATILIIDDDERACRLLEILLKGEGYATLLAADGAEALKLAAQAQPDLILLDLMMPGMSGFAVAGKLKANPETKSIPIIVVSALEDRESVIRGLEAGAEEYLTKPIDRINLKVRVRNLLRLKEFNDFLKNHNQILEEQVEARTRDLQETFIESIYTLMRAAEYRDDETGAHVKRISYYTRVLAEALGMDEAFCDTIFYASTMHDIGKIGIPDHVLLKPGSLTPKEWEIMKTHTTTGATIMAGSSSPYLQMGEQIALGHHERWDGSGYPNGIKGDAIPLAARIMQIADIYDALRSKRPYKKAFDHATSVEIITKGDGRTEPSHFDPDVLAAFKSRADTMNEIFEERRALEETEIKLLPPVLNR
ncbi:MAG: two-component system response regulator [Mariprofundaceae bacterium]|nr:two-component system response regulator [Mariprofundaceae bacterium]